MSGPTQRLPFLTAAEEACLRSGPSGRVGGVATASNFFTYFLRDSCEFAAQFHESLGDRAYKEWPWEQDGQKQYEGSLRKVQFMSPVRNAPELSNETRVDEEQRWVFRGHGHATLEIRRKLPDLRDGDRFVVAVRWVMAFDGFGCNVRISCGTIFFKSSSYAKEIREGCVRGYAQSSKRWFVQAERYAKTYGPIQLRSKSSMDDKDGEEEGDGDADGQGSTKRDLDPVGGIGVQGGGLKKSGRVVTKALCISKPNAWKQAELNETAGEGRGAVNSRADKHFACTDEQIARIRLPISTEHEAGRTVFRRTVRD